MLLWTKTIFGNKGKGFVIFLCLLVLSKWVVTFSVRTEKVFLFIQSHVKQAACLYKSVISNVDRTSHERERREKRKKQNKKTKDNKLLMMCEYMWVYFLGVFSSPSSQLVQSENERDSQMNLIPHRRKTEPYGQ